MDLKTFNKAVGTIFDKPLSDYGFKLKRKKTAQFICDRIYVNGDRYQTTGEWKEIKPGPMRTSGQPDWFNPEDLVEGELYEVAIKHEALYGKIWVDRKNNKVYIRTSYS